MFRVSEPLRHCWETRSVLEASGDGARVIPGNKTCERHDRLTPWVLQEQIRTCNQNVLAVIYLSSQNVASSPPNHIIVVET